MTSTLLTYDWSRSSQQGYLNCFTFSAGRSYNIDTINLEEGYGIPLSENRNWPSWSLAQHPSTQHIAYLTADEHLYKVETGTDQNDNSKCRVTATILPFVDYPAHVATLTTNDGQDLLVVMKRGTLEGTYFTLNKVGDAVNPDGVEPNIHIEYAGYCAEMNSVWYTDEIYRDEQSQIVLQGGCYIDNPDVHVYSYGNYRLDLFRLPHSLSIFYWDYDMAPQDLSPTASLPKKHARLAFYQDPGSFYPQYEFELYSLSDGTFGIWKHQGETTRIALTDETHPRSASVPPQQRNIVVSKDGSLIVYTNYDSQAPGHLKGGICHLKLNPIPEKFKLTEWSCEDLLDVAEDSGLGSSVSPILLAKDPRYLVMADLSLTADGNYANTMRGWVTNPLQNIKRVRSRNSADSFTTRLLWLD